MHGRGGGPARARARRGALWSMVSVRGVGVAASMVRADAAEPLTVGPTAARLAMTAAVSGRSNSIEPVGAAFLIAASPPRSGIAVTGTPHCARRSTRRRVRNAMSYDIIACAFFDTEVSRVKASSVAG